MDYETNPWTTLASRRCYENEWITLDEASVRDPAGCLSLYATIHCKRRSVAIVPLDNEGFTYLVGQYRYGARRYTWEIPGGAGDFDRSSIETATRELQEELGFTAGSWLQLSSCLASAAISDENFQIFLAWNLSDGVPHRDQTEILKIRRICFDDAIALATTGGVQDAASVAGLLLVSAKARAGALPREVCRLLLGSSSSASELAIK